MEEVFLKLPVVWWQSQNLGPDVFPTATIALRPPLLLSFQPAKCLRSSVRTSTVYIHVSTPSHHQGLSHCQYPGNGNHMWLILLSAHHSSHTDRSPRRLLEETQEWGCHKADPERRDWALYSRPKATSQGLLLPPLLL